MLYFSFQSFVSWWPQSLGSSRLKEQMQVKQILPIGCPASLALNSLPEFDFPSGCLTSTRRVQYDLPSLVCEME
jgi:hypothetical protein